MKRMMSIVIVALLMAGATVYACDTCGCKGKKAEKKCEACTAEKKCEKCTEDKQCKGCAKKAKKAQKAEKGE